MSPRTWIVVAALLGALSVGLGAFGAHLLPSWLMSQGIDMQDVDVSELDTPKLESPEIARRLANWETAARYHMYHALAILAAAWLMTRGGGMSANIAGWCFLAGTAIFSGCLYALVLSGVKVLGAVVPIGGVLLIIGWLALAVAGWRLNHVARLEED